MNCIEYAKFYEKHKTEIDAYRKSTEYLKKHLNGKTTIPTKGWKAEFKELTEKRYTLCDKYYGLRSEIKSVEQLRHSAEAYIDVNMPDVERQKPVDSATKDAKATASTQVAKKPVDKKEAERKFPITERLAQAKKEVDTYNAERIFNRLKNGNKDLEI